MFLLYLIGILCSLIMFAPSMIPGYVKFPVALVIALLMVFFFNLSKKDTVYTVNRPRNEIVRCGLFSPLLTYIAASSYTLGFAMVFTYLSENNIVDILANVDGILGALGELNVILGLVFIILAIVLYVVRNAFRTHAGEMSLQKRSAWYIVLTLVALGLGVYTICNYYSFDVYEYLNEGSNLYIYFGIAGAVVLIDLICNIIVACVNHKRGYRRPVKVVRRKTAKQEYKEAKKALKKKYKYQKKAAKKAEKLAKKSAKRAKKAAKIAAKRARKAAKKEMKLAKINAKKEKKLAKKQAKAEKKIEKKNNKLAKKAGKKSARLAKKAAKKAAKLAKKNSK